MWRQASREWARAWNVGLLVLLDITKQMNASLVLLLHVRIEPSDFSVHTEYRTYRLLSTSASRTLLQLTKPQISTLLRKIIFNTHEFKFSSQFD